MKQTYTYEVNGFQIHAEYEEKDIETIFIPLLQKWKEMQKKAGRRILVFLSAPPGTGKTTLVQFWNICQRRKQIWSRYRPSVWMDFIIISSIS